MNFDAAIFDLDGVIVDSRTPVRTAINAALERHGFPPRDPGELDRFIGPPALDAFVELTGEPQGSDGRLGLGSRFHPVCAPGDAVGEPKARLVARALRKLAVRRAVVVGDRCFDVEAAHANGIPALGVTWGIGDRRELERAGADAILDDPSQLLRALARGYGGQW